MAIGKRNAPQQIILYDKQEDSEIICYVDRPIKEREIAFQIAHIQNGEVQKTTNKYFFGDQNIASNKKYKQLAIINNLSSKFYNNIKLVLATENHADFVSLSSHTYDLKPRRIGLLEENIMEHYDLAKRKKVIEQAKEEKDFKRKVNIFSNAILDEYRQEVINKISRKEGEYKSLFSNNYRNETLKHEATIYLEPQTHFFQIKGKQYGLIAFQEMRIKDEKHNFFENHSTNTPFEEMASTIPNDTKFWLYEQGITHPQELHEQTYRPTGIFEYYYTNGNVTSEMSVQEAKLDEQGEIRIPVQFDLQISNWFTKKEKQEEITLMYKPRG